MIVHYVAGYGRSGSTTLGRVIAQNGGAVGVGEVAVLGDGSFVEDARCSCALSYGQCPYWTGVESGLIAREGTAKLPMMGRWEGLAGLVLPMRILRRLVHSRAYSTAHPSVAWADGIAALCDSAGGAIVDTSKTTRRTANRPRLLVASGAAVELWLPTRPLADVVASHRAAQRRRGRRGLWARSAIAVVPSRTLSFATARWCATLLRRPLNRSSLDETVEAFEALDGVDVVEHLIAGNRNRHRGL